MLPKEYGIDRSESEMTHRSNMQSLSLSKIQPRGLRGEHTRKKGKGQNKKIIRPGKPNCCFYCDKVK